MMTQIVMGFAPTAALRHCEEARRSNPRMRLEVNSMAFLWVVSLDCFVPRNDAKRVKKEGRHFSSLASYVTKTLTL